MHQALKTQIVLLAIPITGFKDSFNKLIIAYG